MDTTVQRKLIILSIFLMTMSTALPSEASSVYVYGGPSIARYDTDGSNGANVPSNGWSVVAIADDPVNDDIYRWTSWDGSHDLSRDADPTNNPGNDITQLRFFNEPRQHHYGMDFDPLTRTLFYSNYVSGSTDRTYIWSHDVDTNSAIAIYSASSNSYFVRDVAVDPIHQYVYWTDSTAGTVNRLYLGGGGVVEVLYSGLAAPFGIALDAGAGTLFWTEYGDSSNGYNALIRSGSTDGAGSPTTLLSYDYGSSPSGFPYFSDVDVDPETAKVFFTGESNQNQVRTMDYNGQNVEYFKTPGGSQIHGYAVDVSSALPECSDGLDNDGDGMTDSPADPGCAEAFDGSEKDDTGTYPCDDGLDNEEPVGDTLVDFRADGSGDPGCRDPFFRTEEPECQDGRDNDGDFLIDFDGGLSALGYVKSFADPHCFVPSKNQEAKSYICGLGVELALLLPPLMWLSRRRSLR